MLSHLVDVSIRSLLIAFAAASVLWIARRGRSAALQHAVWTVVVCGMLSLFVFGAYLPRMPLPDTGPRYYLGRDFDRCVN